MITPEQALEWPENIVADRHEVTGKWVIQYATDEQAKTMMEALTHFARQPAKQAIIHDGEERN